MPIVDTLLSIFTSSFELFPSILIRYPSIKISPVPKNKTHKIKFVEKEIHDRRFFLSLLEDLFHPAAFYI